MYYANEQQQLFVENLMTRIIPTHEFGSCTGGFRKTKIKGSSLFYSTFGHIADDIICLLALYLYDGGSALADEQYFSYTTDSNIIYHLSVKKAHNIGSVTIESMNFISQLS